MDEIAKRIKELIDKENLNNTEFASRINTNPAIISHILSGRNKPSLQLIQSVKSYFTNVNIDYLLTGAGVLYNDFTNVKNNDFDLPLPPSENESLRSQGFDDGVRVLGEPQGAPLPKKQNQQKQDLHTPTSNPDKIVASEPLQESKQTQNHVYKNTDNKQIERIVIFYSDKTFIEYKP